jgi:hypothetical protein
MDLSKVLEQLRKELETLDIAILSLERLQSKGVRRGRPPKILAELRQPAKLGARALVIPRRQARRGIPIG